MEQNRKDILASEAPTLPLVPITTETSTLPGPLIPPLQPSRKHIIVSPLSDPKKRLKNSILVFLNDRRQILSKIVFRLPFIPLFKKLTISLAKEAKKHKNGYN